MLASVFYFLPCLVSIVWLAIYAFRRKNRTQRILGRIIILGSFYFACLGLYIHPNTNYELMTYMDFVIIPVILLLLTEVIRYQYTHLFREHIPLHKIQILYIPAIIMTSICWILYLIIGFEESTKFFMVLDELKGNTPYIGLSDSVPEIYQNSLYRTFYFADEVGINIICGIYAIFIFYYCHRISKSDNYKFGDIFKFWFLKQGTTPRRAISFCLTTIFLSTTPIIILGRSFVLAHPLLGLLIVLILSIGLFCLCYVEYFNHLPVFDLYHLAHADLGSEKADSPNNVRQPEDITKTISDKVAAKNEEKKALLIAAIEEEQVYLNPDVRLNSLAERLGTNRSRLSFLVNETYDMDFKTLIATRRIEEAKLYMLDKPDETMEQVALHCGFKDVAAFCHRFKDITGDSPRVWISKQ